MLDQGHEVKYIVKKCESTLTEVTIVLNSASFQDWQRSSALSELGGRGARVAISALVEICSDKKAASQARVSAADKLLHYTGLKLDGEGNIDKTPANMTATELTNRLLQLQKEENNRRREMKTIDGEKVENNIGGVEDLL